MTNKAYLLLGSNEGNRLQWLDSAIQILKENCGVIVSISSIYETAAWGLEDQPGFLNMAICIQTELSPTELLKEINNIETDLGRQRTIKWGQRTLDIDILFYNDHIIQKPNLTIPHPEIANRRFALAPLNDIAADLVHPVSQKTISQLLVETTDNLPVKKLAISLPS